MVELKETKWKKGVSFSILTAVFGLMLAIQFQTIQEPEVRDTRDMWQLREDLKREQQLQMDLLTEIRKYDQIIETYNIENNQNPETVLKDTLLTLKEEAGLTDVTGAGIIVTIDRLFDEDLIGTKIENVSPDLLKRLINELNSYDAEHIAIAGQRYINTTVIRDINGVTKMDNFSLNRFPLEFKIIAEDADKLYNRMNASTTDEDFAIDNLSLNVSEPLRELMVPAYEDTIRVKNMELLDSDEGGQ